MPNTADHCGGLTPAPAAAHAARPASGRVRRGLLALGLATLLATTTGCVERLFFQPDQQVYTTPAQFGLSAQDLYFNAPDGSRLHGWWLPAQLAPGAQAKGTVLHLHGNAANVSNHLPAVAWLPAQGWHVLTFDYRGFGQSQGRPTLDGVVEDAQAALNALRQQPGVDPKRIVVFGQSLGGATALRLLAQDSAGVVGAVIDSAFASYRGIAREAAAKSALLGAVAPAGVKLLPGPEKDPVTAAAKVSVPTLLIHGTADRIVDHQNSYQLAVALNALSPPDRPPEVLELRDGQHIEAMRRPEIRSAVLERMNAWLRAADAPAPPVFVPQMPLTSPEPGSIQRGPPPAPGPKPATPSA
jgi:fermentation-respiration switch protein FrsA (DUF1100 family)